VSGTKRSATLAAGLNVLKLCDSQNLSTMKKNSQKPANYYEMLGVDPKADPEEIKRAYYAKLKIWHPDRNADRLDAAEEITKALNQAYGVLSDPEGRKQYDRMRRFTQGQDFGKVLNEKEFWEKIEKAAPALKRILKDLKDLYALFVDSIKGRYKLHPAVLSIIGGGLLYFIIPLDLIPDYLPVVGLLDDLALLSMIINSMQKELGDYRKSRE
jgi:uncharacterized membrane protein YkvA (DUF1232 family)